MRNLKRALSLALASVMVLGMMVVGAGAASYDEFSDKDKIVNKDAVSMLVELNVINGKDDNSFDPTGIITRAEMAKLVCVVLNGGKDPNLGSAVTSTYTDTVGNWAAGYIEYCSTKGIVAGDGTGKFNPTNTVTGAEAAKMLLAALGYKAEVEGFTGGNWATFVNVKANEVGLYDGLSIDPAAGLNRDNAAQMVYNAMDANTVKYTSAVTVDGVTIGNSQLVVNTTNMLEDKFGVTRTEAIVVGNEYGTVSGKSSASEKEGYTRIALLNDDDGDPITPKAAAGTYKVSTPVEMLGQSVTMYIKYKTDKSEKDAIVFGNPIIRSSNKVVTVTNGDGVADIMDDHDLELSGSVTLKGGKKDEADKITLNATILKNYGTVSCVDKVANWDDDDNATLVDFVDETVAAKKGGSLTVIDNDGDDVIDYILYTTYTAGAVTQYSTKDKGSIRIAGMAEKNENAKEEVIGFEDVKQGDYVLFTEYGGKVYVEKPETLEGELEAYSTSKSNAKIDGTTIDWSGIPNTTGSTDADLETIASYVDTTVIGNSATFYLDKFGYILAVGDAEDATYNYAVVLGTQDYESAAGGSLGTDAKVKLLLADGTTVTYPVYSVDGVRPGKDGYADANIDDLVSYSVTSADEVKVKILDSAADGTSVTFNKGKASISLDGNHAVTSNTIFLYNDDGDITRYVGKNAPSISGSYTAGVIDVKGEAKVVYVKNAPEGFSDDYIYIYKTKVSENSDGYDVAAIVNGKIEDVIIASDSFQAYQLEKDGEKVDMKITTGLYNFTVDSDGIYTLKDTSGDVVVGATVQKATSEYVRVKESDNSVNTYVLTDKTATFYARTDKTAQENEVISEKDTVTLVLDEGEVVYCFVTYYGADKEV